MLGCRTSIGSRKGLAFLIAALALLVQGVVPSGYMVARSVDSGSIVLQICAPNSTQKYVSVDLATGESTIIDGASPRAPSDGDPEDDGQTVCPQSLVSSANALPLSSFTLDAPLEQRTKLSLIRGPPLFSAHSASPFARGPPRSV